MPRADIDARDRNILSHILAYCNDIAVTHSEFGYSKERFISTRTYQNAIGMCILQIGELVKHLSPDLPLHTPRLIGVERHARAILMRTIMDA